MPNQSGNAYGLTVLSPLKEIDGSGQAVIPKLRNLIQSFNELDTTPMAKVPNTYLSRLWILEDVFFENYPHELEHLKSKYLVFTSNFHGELDTYLEGMFNAIPTEVQSIWQDCYGFDDKALSPEGFKSYIKKCQVETTFYFNGSTDDSLQDQLKSLYIKQEFSRFVFDNAHKSSEELLTAFKAFIAETQPTADFPRWKPGESDLSDIIDRGNNDHLSTN
ncbi:MAG: hypothetical protein R8G66_02455 [Cytophagales bacterium]|nr:hypothetical protein [Cytophagales bacterium]